MNGLAKSRISPDYCKPSRANIQTIDLQKGGMMTRSKRGTVFGELTGKTVNSVKYEENFDWQALEVACSDGTIFSVEFGARVIVQASYLRSHKGNLDMIRNYGQVSGSPDRKG